MNNLAVIAYFKDEAHILNEWIAHHLSFGIEYFYLIDNSSSDGFRDVLNQYSGKFTLIDGQCITQLEAYKKAYHIARSSHKWIALIDLDEFLYVTNEDKSIPGLLNALDSKVKAACIYWKIFLPTQMYQPQSVIQSSTRICREDSVSMRPFKSIFRTSLDVENLSIHCPRGLTEDEKKVFLPTDSSLQLNHYRFQSYEYLLGVKAQRGGGVNKSKYKGDDSFDLLKRYFSIESEYSYELLNMSQAIIEKIERDEQIRPSVDVYSSIYWKTLVNRAPDFDNLSYLELFKKVFENEKGEL